MLNVCDFVISANPFGQQVETGEEKVIDKSLVIFKAKATWICSTLWYRNQYKMTALIIQLEVVFSSL